MGARECLKCKSFGRWLSASLRAPVGGEWPLLSSRLSRLKTPLLEAALHTKRRLISACNQLAQFESQSRVGP